KGMMEPRAAELPERDRNRVAGTRGALPGPLPREGEGGGSPSDEAEYWEAVADESALEAAIRHQEQTEFCNCRVEIMTVGEGPDEKEKEIRVPIGISEIYKKLITILPKPIEKLNNTLFIETADHQPQFIKSTAALFACISNWAMVTWPRG